MHPALVVMDYLPIFLTFTVTLVDASVRRPGADRGGRSGTAEHRLGDLGVVVPWFFFFVLELGGAVTGYMLVDGFSWRVIFN